MSAVICCIARGGWYPRGAARLIHKFSAVSPGFEIKAWVNTVPPGAPAEVYEAGYDYSAYCQKPFALLDVMQSGADIGILMDVAFYPIAPIHPLVDHIQRNGYYLCRNGNQVGHWSSDRCLDRMGMTRDDALTVEEISSYCVGLNFRDGRCIELLQRWCGFAGDRQTFPGPHTNVNYRDPTRLDNGEQLHWQGRNPGVASIDPRVQGHRHDQTALSILAHRMGMRELTNRPVFTAYLGSEDGRTVLVNHGGI